MRSSLLFTYSEITATLPALIAANHAILDRIEVHVDEL
jgi:hypothetical protein